MGKDEKEVVSKGMRITVANPEEMHKQKVAEVERLNKLNAMKIAMTHIEIQGLTVEPKEATEIADKFLEWLKK